MLPVELLDLILDGLDPADAPPVLAAVSQASLTLLALAGPRLYGDVTLRVSRGFHRFFCEAAPPPTRRLGSSRPPPPSRVTPYLSLAQTRQVTLIVDQAVQTRIPAGLPSRLPNGGKPLQLSSLRVSFAVRTAAVDHLLPFFDPIACVFEVASSFEPLSHFKFAGTTGWSQLETLVLDDVSTLSAMQPYGRFDRSNPRRNLQGVQAIFRYSDFIASRTIVEQFSAELNDGVLLPALNADAATLQVASEAIKRSVRREMLSLEERDVFSGLGRWRIQVDETLARCLGETLGRPKSGEK